MLRSLFLGHGVVVNTLTTPPGTSISIQNELILYVNHGAAHDSHGSRSSQVDGREDVLRAMADAQKGTLMAHLRHLSLVSVEESNETALAMGLPDGNMPYGLQAENIVVEGFEDFSHLPCGGLLLFYDTATGQPRTASLYITARNNPCGQPHANIVRYLQEHGIGEPRMPYIQEAQGRRGLVALVKTNGIVRPGDTVTMWEHN